MISGLGATRPRTVALCPVVAIWVYMHPSEFLGSTLPSKDWAEKVAILV